LTKYPYPKSFPNGKQLLFLKTVLAPKNEFIPLWKQWKSETDLDLIDKSTFRLLPALYLRIKQEENFEDEWLGKVKGVYRQGWVKNQLFLATASSVVAAFNAKGIPSIFMKGIALLLSSYSDLGGRMMGDIDILIPKDKACEASNLMLSAGYSCVRVPGIKQFNQQNILRFTRGNHELSFKSGNGHIVDLHFISPFYTVVDPKLIALFWNTAVHVEINSIPSLALSPELTFLHVCCHGTIYNSQPSYRWVMDAMQTLKTSSSFDWKELIEMSKAMDLMFHLKMATIYLNENFLISIPEDEFQVIKSYVPSAGEKWQYYKYARQHPFKFTYLSVMWKKFQIENGSKSTFFAWYSFLDFLKETYGLEHKRSLLLFYINTLILRFKSS